MPLRRILLIALALCAAGVTIAIGHAWRAPERVAQAPAPVESKNTRILVASGSLSAGQFIRPENLHWQVWPPEGLNPLYAVEGKAKIEDYVGAVVRSAMGDGEPVTEGRLVRPGDRGFLAAVLTPGYRALTVPVTVSSGLAGFVFPGDHVDLLLTMTIAESGGEKRQRHAAETLLTDLRVLAVDQRVDDQSKDVVVAKTATLEVTPKQAETIAVAADIGTLSLTLRSIGRSASGDTSHPFSHTWDNEATHLLPPPGADPSKPQGPAPFKVNVVRGGDVKEMQFARSNQ